MKGPAPVPEDSGAKSLFAWSVRNRIGLLTGILVGAWILWILPLAWGERTLHLRDVFMMHLPWKAFGAEALSEGLVPATNPTWGMGRPFRGDPNALPFYPGNGLYLLLPFWSAFNLHYAVHWLLAFFTFRGLSRELGRSELASLIAASSYALAGWGVSTLSSYNLVAVTAWWPLAIWGVVKNDRRGLAVSGIAVGLSLLGGAPDTALLGWFFLLVLAVDLHGWRRGTGGAVLCGAAGLLVALPQVVATVRILPFVRRSVLGVAGGERWFYALHPVRLLELIIPYPLGRPWVAGGMWTGSWLPDTPLIFTLYAGVLALPLALVGRRARGCARTVGSLVLGGLLLAMAGGAVPGLMPALFGGMVRYSEKFLFWVALGLPLLVGRGVDALRERADPAAVFWVGIGGVSTSAGIGLALWSGPLRRRVERMAVDGAVGRKSVEGFLLWTTVSLLVAGSALVLYGLLTRRRGRAGPVSVLQLASLAPLLLLVSTVSVDGLEEAAPPPATGETRDVLLTGDTQPVWEEPPRVEPIPVAESRILLSKLGYAGMGVLRGHRYPLAPDVDGMGTPPLQALSAALARSSWDARLAWGRRLGIDLVVGYGDVVPDGLDLVRRVSGHGLRAWTGRLANSAPEVRWPRRVVSGLPPLHPADSRSHVPARWSRDHCAGGAIRREPWSPDRIRVDVESCGGVLVVQRAYLPLWQARLGASGGKLPVFPVDSVLLGVRVPEGRHEVVLTISSLPEALAGAVAGLAFAILLVPITARR
ncbi:MAG: hypothetical protein R3234_07960 [Thermoanaerobaculia bacterium]|nr:hypothetical protein [Thermoanaerobaculia bacterium]